MRLSNGLELTYHKESNRVVFTKLIKNKLWQLMADCESCKLLFLLAEGYSQYTNEEFMAEATAVGD